MQHKEEENTSIVFVKDEKIYTKSTASLKICGHLSGGWKLAQALRIIAPFIRAAIYNFIARRRYRWFGKRQKYMLPAPELKKRFLA